MNVEAKSSSLMTGDGTMPLHVARPKGASGKLAVVIVIQEAFGLNPNITGIADRFAGEGYMAIAPNLYYREGGTVVGYDQLPEAIGLMTRLTDDQVLADLGHLVKQLRSDPQARVDRIGITGFCMGGRISYLAACEIAEIRASVPFYGGAIAGPQMTPGAKPPVERTAKMKASIMLHFGEKDSYIPLSAVDEIRKTLEREKKDFQIFVYPGAGHGFFCSERADYDAGAAELAWERTRDFFAKHLKV